MAELTEEEKAKAAADKAAAPKKQKYADLPMDATIVFEVTVHDTKVEDGAVELAPKKVEKSGTKAFWEGLEEWPKGHSKAGQKKDITDGIRTPKLIGYVDGGSVVKF